MFGFAGYIAGQTIVGVIGQLYGFVFVCVAEYGQHWPEDFFARNHHVVADIGEYGWFNVITGFQAGGFVRATGNQFSAFGDALLDQMLNLVELRFAGYRANTGALIGGIARDGFRGGSFGNLDGFCHTCLGHQHAGWGIAGLAGIAETSHHTATNGFGEIGVIQNDIG